MIIYLVDYILHHWPESAKWSYQDEYHMSTKYNASLWNLVQQMYKVVENETVQVP